jgi:murein DD-endopeptidase MepM/ murein hydrolase activator NlpD
MPVTAMRANEPLGLRTRLLLGAMVVVLLGSLGVAASPRAEARNWMREISATRASQLYYESLMRAADSEVRSLKHARTQTRRSLKVAQRRLEAAADRRGQAKRDLQLTRTRARLSRLSLAAAAFETPPPPDAATAVLSLTGAGDVDGIASVPIVAQAAAPNLGLLSAPGSGHPPALQADVSVSDVVALERQVAKQQRTFQQARQRALRAWRIVRAKRNSLASMAMRQRSATARREGAEAALAGRILAMSDLAQRRVAKKTNVRPGLNSGFTWPTRGRISQTYGCTGFYLNPPRGSCRHFHDGLDIAGYQGTAIRAAAVGVVSYIGWNPWDQSGRAFMIVVAHPGGYESLYGHVLPTRQVRVGQIVHRGEVIGSMGNTGRSTGVHLHFGLRRGSTTLNPLAFL